MRTAGSLHILHIESDETLAEECWRALLDCGLEFKVTLATTRDAYRKALAAGDVDIVLSDSCGYDFDGAEALDYVRVNYPGIPMLVLSDCYVNRDPRLLKAEGAADCLSMGHLRRLAPAILRATTDASHSRPRAAAAITLNRVEA